MATFAFVVGNVCAGVLIACAAYWLGREKVLG